MQILVIGASGYLGKHVYEQFKKRYDRVIGTYYAHRTDDTLVHFDINKDDIECLGALGEDEVRCAIICAAESKFDACKINAEESFRTNVLSTIKLIEALRKMNYYIIFCSTDSVFDGLKGNYIETDQACPVNEYGKMKKQVEQYIGQKCPDVCIFRLSKMFGDIYAAGDTFLDWKKSAREKKDIYCIEGNFFSPVDVEDVVNCMDLACRIKACGIYHICGNKVYSRLELCLSFLQAMNLKTNVYEKRLEDFGFSANRPLNVGMVNKKATDILGYKFKDMEKVFERYKNI